MSKITQKIDKTFILFIITILSLDIYLTLRKLEHINQKMIEKRLENKHFLGIFYVKRIRK